HRKALRTFWRALPPQFWRAVVATAAEPVKDMFIADGACVFHGRARQPKICCRRYAGKHEDCQQLAPYASHTLSSLLSIPLRCLRLKLFALLIGTHQTGFAQNVALHGLFELCLGRLLQIRQYGIQRVELVEIPMAAGRRAGSTVARTLPVVHTIPG